MRIASTQFHAIMNSSLQTANTGLAHVIEQMSSGQRVQRPSDDTIASMRLSRLSREEAAMSQYQDNIGALRSRLRNNETLLTSLNQDMLQVRDLLVWAADGANTPADMAAMASSLESLRDSLLHTANSRDSEGHFLFSGTFTDRPPIPAVSDALATPPITAFVYAGNMATQEVAVGPGVTVPANVTLEEMAALVKQLDTLATNLKGPPLMSAAAAQPQVAATLNLLDTTMNSVTSKIGSLGGLQTVLQTLEDNQAAVSLSNKQASLTLGQLDYGEAAVRLNSYTIAVQATQKAYGRVSNLSLFDVL
ncbi:flagellar hook-associated protein FlgL [Roseateles violae]|uniref:Flagellar hook-associated protein FlgL n=1 Tax=Roseateles violae TaxID=3058042 RepID=A0ABT8DTM3_9BURK|nr:flagellar hook-associated protein FlgL [Pelomonas sp. PFR6]MDN3921547.1 flagellar hook-associated protein FlgL [Pelomonas sp. PFR6]